MCVCVCVSGETGMCLEGEMCVSESVGTDSGMWRERRWGVEKEATWIFMYIERLVYVSVCMWRLGDEGGRDTNCMCECVCV